MLLIDGFPAFRQEFDSTSVGAPWFEVVHRLIADGRNLGIHVAISADRSGSVPTAIASSIQRRVVLRMADDAGYSLLEVPTDILGPGSPPGRAIVDDLEIQIAIAGPLTSDISEARGSGSRISDADQAHAIEGIGAVIAKTGRSLAQSVGVLPKEYPMGDLPELVGGLPVLGLSEEDLEPIGFEPSGTLLVAGPPGSGRTSALAALAESIRRAIPGVELYYLGNARSGLAGAKGWKESAIAVDRVGDLARKLAPKLKSESGKKVVVIIEGTADFLGTVADDALLALAKVARRSNNLLIAEGETSSWQGSWPLLAEVKASRAGILLQPDPFDGESLLKTALPRTVRSDFPPGRGFYISQGKYARVQLPLVTEEKGGR